MDNAENGVPVAGEIFEQRGVGAWNACISVGEEEDRKLPRRDSRCGIELGMCPNFLQPIEDRFGRAEKLREASHLGEPLA